MPSHREGRQERFKPTITAAAFRQSRAVYSLNIRRARRDNVLLQRRSRQLVPTTTNNSIVPAQQTSIEYQHCINVLIQAQFYAREGQEADQSMRDAVKSLVRLTRPNSDDRHPLPPYKDMMDRGILVALVYCLDFSNDLDMIFNVLLAMTNLAASDYTKEFAASGITPRLVDFLMHSSYNIRGQAAWCLGNIAGEGVALRDHVLSIPNTVPGLVRNMKIPVTSSVLQKMLWATANMLNGNPSPPLDVTIRLFHGLVSVIQELESGLNIAAHAKVDLLCNTVRALSYIASGDGEHHHHKIELLANSRVIPMLMASLGCPEVKILIPAMDCLASMATGPDEVTQQIVDWGILGHIDRLIHHEHKRVHKSCHFLLLNIARGSGAQLEELFKYGFLLESIVTAAQKATFHVKQQAVHAVCNIFCHGDFAMVVQMVQLGGLLPLCFALEPLLSSLQPDEQVIEHVLMTFSNLLQLIYSNGKNSNNNKNEELLALVKDTLVTYKVRENIEELQARCSQTISDLCATVIKEVFDDSDDDDSNIGRENMGAAASPTTYQCGPSPPANPSPLMTWPFSPLSTTTTRNDSPSTFGRVNSRLMNPNH